MENSPRKTSTSTASGSVAVLLKGFPRISETFILNELLLLEEAGLQLTVYALRNPGESQVHEKVKHLRAPVRYIPDYFWPNFAGIVWANLKQFFRQPSRYWPAFSFALRRSLRRWSASTIKRFSQAAYLVEHYLRKERPDQIYAHFSHGPTTVAYFARWLTGIPYSFSAHAKDIYLQEDTFLRAKVDGAKFVVTCTGFNVQHLRRVAQNPEKIHLCYHGVDVSQFSFRGPRREMGRPPVILSVGRFVPKKGFPVLIKALSHLHSRGVDFRAYLIGGGELKPQLKALTAELGLTEKVALLGKMPQEKLLSYYQQADILALACQVEADGDRDGIPNVLVEAMAMGIPVVSTQVSGIPELIHDGRNGLLVEQKDPVALADALQQLIEQPELAGRLAAAARWTVEQNFNARVNVRKILHLLVGGEDGPGVPCYSPAVAQMSPSLSSNPVDK
ncbi:MAG: colanic acid biosynthesis glycosyltransferase WcaL [Calditrichaeota bacterium]|nr:MAG: colanic acid biosynthesis glycosyltransferase WcaL [Calditrichota bacterium]